MNDVPRRARVWPWVLFAFVIIALVQLTLVRLAGTDIPFLDQWGIEGSWLYPSWREGSFHLRDAFRPGNENRIAWTLLLDLALFVANGDRWDPLVQMFVGAGLRAACGSALVWMFARECGRRGWALVTALLILAFLPQLPWHNALWGIETHAYFVVGFMLLTLVLLTAQRRMPVMTALGLLAGVAAFVAMAPGSLIPFALIGLAAVRGAEARDWRLWTRESWPGALLLALALVLRVRHPAHAVLEPTTFAQFLVATGRALAWPHVSQPLAAIVLNAPLVAVVLSRVLRRRHEAAGEDFAIALGLWGVAVALAIGWARGGSPELLFGVPSRYADFLVMLPIANAWCVFVLLRSLPYHRRRLGFGLAGAWAVFLAIGWIGLSAEMMRRVIIPRIEDRDAPVRLAVAFQRGRDPAVFAGQPRLLVPHTDPRSITAVLDDPWMRGCLPPSLQPTEPMGPLSRFVRFVLRR